jgi:hypothetical protein
MEEGLSGISAGVSVDIKRTDGEYLAMLSICGNLYAVRCSCYFA